MPRISFTDNLKAHIDSPSLTLPGQSVKELLDRVFEGHPMLRGYILDDQGTLRQHMHVFVNGQLIKDRQGLSDILSEESEVYVMQALSGG